jgi:hypothetical protein
LFVVVVFLTRKKKSKALGTTPHFTSFSLNVWFEGEKIKTLFQNMSKYCSYTADEDAEVNDCVERIVNVGAHYEQIIIWGHLVTGFVQLSDVRVELNLNL